MSFQDHPSKGKGTSVLTSWLWGLSIPTKFWLKRINRTSLIFELPDEIFINILSNLPTYQPENAYCRVDLHGRFVIDSPYLSSMYGTRRGVLLALTQVCRSMREKFLPWFWEHMQYLSVRSPGINSSTCYRLALDEVFRRHSRTLIGAPSLAAHVRTLSVNMPNPPGLANLLQLLPNLKTLEVLTPDHENPIAERSFETVKLPQVRTLIIGSYVHYLMKCCTNATRVMVRQQDYDAAYLNSVSFVADSLVYFALCLPTFEHIEELVRLYPNLEELGIVQPDCYEVPVCITAAQGLGKLRLLEVVLPCFITYRHPPRHTWESQMTAHAINVLGNISGHTKVLKIISLGYSRTSVDIRDVKTQTITVP